MAIGLEPIRYSSLSPVRSGAGVQIGRGAVDEAVCFA